MSPSPDPATTSWVPVGPGSPQVPLCAFESAQGPSVNLGAGAWVTVPVGTSTSPIYSIPSGAFTPNADGSVTVRDAGLYTLKATLTTGSPTNGTYTVIFASTANDWQGGYSILASGWCAPSGATYIQIGGDLQLTAGAKIFVNIIAGIATTGNIIQLAISRIGQGPPGPIGPAGPTGAAGTSGSGVPTPIVNGQWVKGSGGAAVWSPIVAGDISGSINGQFLKGTGGAATWSGIVQGDLPANIGALTRSWDHNDLNSIVDSGWYNGSAMGNAPDGRGDWLFILHISHQNGPAWSTQVCWTMQTFPTEQYMRCCTGGPWQPWVRASGIRGQFYCGAGSGARLGGGFGAYDVDGDHTCYVYFSPALSYTPIVTTSIDGAITPMITSVSSGGFYCTLRSQGGGFGQGNVMFHAMPASI
jgi:hypothetical protein